MFVRTQKKKIPILMYHSISYTVNSRFRQFTVSPASFAEQMAYLHQCAYTPITITQFVRTLAQEEDELPERPIVLTFDDGFADFFTSALPILKQYNFAATLYVPTAFVGGTSSWLRHERETTRLMLTWEQLGEISKGRVECGAHSHSHPQLDILPYAIARDEILRSKRLLEDHLGKKIFSFSYPYGYHVASIRQLVQEAGYMSACAVRHTLSSEIDDPYSLARLMIRADTSIEELAALLIGRSSSTAIATYKIYARVRTPVWQLVRRCRASVRQYSQERRLA